MSKITPSQITPREFYVIIERDEDGIYVGEVQQLRACYSQGDTIDELMSNMKEAIELCLKEKDFFLISGLARKIQRIVQWRSDETGSSLWILRHG